ncbi:type IV secretory system conjugative DNA transfer family protein [Serratia sp. OPWLW2]|uniref:type IV secretory system conjugative DNA transfer family protein n=1 Tax=Serratia sp. OPWLW2 TaxID=1928658 RepID=UPI000C1A63B1|nr:type IV secretory system conjugative DNA transfer family protein [Serratia sp. OPWLW2]PIJ42807.1 conjugal transfer protein [Serratia sp. OPWLW2]
MSATKQTNKQINKKPPKGWAWKDGRLWQKEITTYPALLMGKDPYSNHFLATYGQTYLMLAAPPGSGKGVGIVVPNLLQYPHSVVVNDCKFENWHLTAGFRRACGQRVLRFSPERLETHHWNPLSVINQDPLERLGEVRTLASSLYVPDNMKNASWFAKARDMFTAIVLYLIETPELPFSLPQCYEIAAQGTQLGVWAQNVIDERSASDKPLSAETVRELNIIISESKGKEFAQQMSFVTGRLSVYGEKLVALALTESDDPEENIDFSTLRERPTSIYFCVTEGALKKFGPLMNLFFSQAIRENSKVLPEQGGHVELDDGRMALRLRYQVLFLMDEFAVMKRIEVMETAPALTRGAGLRYLIIFQNKSQVCSDECYGREGGKAVIEPFHVETVYAPGNIEVATEYSKRLGNTTIRVASSNQNVSEGQRRSKGRSFTLQARPLMLPQEVNELPYGEELVFMQPTKQTPAMKIHCRKIFWYEEPVFRARVNEDTYPLPPVPAGDATKVETLVVPMTTAKKGPVTLSSPQGDSLKDEQRRRDAGVPENMTQSDMEDESSYTDE